MTASLTTNLTGREDTNRRHRFLNKLPIWIACIFALALGTLPTLAQTGGQGALEGTVTDPSGAVVPKAKVDVTAKSTGLVTSTISTSAGLYSVTPLIPDLYTVTVTAPGFKATKQENIEVNGLNVTGLNVKLAVGDQVDVVTVTEAPPVLQTTSATVGAVITDETYESLPLVMNNQQRDPTAFATLAPGAQAGARAPIFSGTGNYLAEVYIDGIPTTTANQQGDNRVVSNGVPVESVDQLQIVSSAPSAEYQGAGAIGFTIKSGGSQYHGQVVDLVRNTIFDTWGFQGNQQTKYAIVNGASTQVPAGKPVEHQNEISASVGGPIPFTRKKGYFFVNYDKFHGRTGVNPTLFTVPTALMKTGDFTELNCGSLAGCIGSGLTGTTSPNTAFIYNPLTNSCAGTTCTRQPFQAQKNGITTNNIIPSNYLSPISLAEQKYLPNPNIPNTLVNNYIEGGTSGYDNHELIFKVDYDWSKKQRYSFVYSHGVRQSVGYGAVLPLPYTNGDSSIISPTMLIFEHSYTIGSNKVNQFKYAFTRFPQPVLAPTDNLAPYRASDFGITGLPAGQAAGNFPGTTFGTNSFSSVGQTMWTEDGASDATHNVVPNAYTLVDNFQWSKGQHNMTFGIQMQWLQDNTTSQSSPSGIFTQAFVPGSTGNYTGNSINSTTGYGYASFLLGAVNSSATSVPLFTETGGRYRPISPYFQDDWKVRPNLTINLGLRYDYLPPYHEAEDRWSFFNPNINNPLTGSPGELQYAGYRGAALSCQCRTPVQTYWKNWGPRVGLEWSVDDKTVIRAGFAIAYSRAGGVGGRAGDSTGTGQGGFGSNIVLPSAVTTGVAAGPSYYLNNSAAFMAAGVANTNFGGPGYSIPTPAGPSATSLLNGIGDYTSSTGAYVTSSGAPAYADPYLSGRAPTFNFYNFAMQKVITRNMTVTAGYSGSQSHFVAGAGVPGFWSGQIDPAYLPSLATRYASDGSTLLLGAPATAANIALAQAANPNVTVPYATYAQPVGGNNSTATIGRMLRPYPQYSSPPSPEWDNIANLSYNAFELTLSQREYKGVSFTVNYTYSRNVGDDGTTRSAFAVPAAASSSGVALPGNNRADRDLVATDVPENLNIYGLAKSPFGRDKIGGNNWAVRNVLGGWQTAGIFTYASGTPILVTGTSCNTPSSGTCMPDVVQGRANSIRINGGYGGPGVTYANYTQTKYLDTTAFQTLQVFPVSNPATVPITKIGDAPRSSLNLWSPSHYNLDMAVQRTFAITHDRLRFTFRADCFDVTNKVTFSLPQAQTVAATFASTTTTNKVAAPGTIVPASASPAFGQLTSFSGNRKFQFSGRIVF